MCTLCCMLCFCNCANLATVGRLNVVVMFKPYLISPAFRVHPAGEQNTGTTSHSDLRSTPTVNYSTPDWIAQMDPVKRSTNWPSQFPTCICQLHLWTLRTHTDVRSYNLEGEKPPASGTPTANLLALSWQCHPRLMLWPTILCDLPNLHKVKVTRGSRAFQGKAGKVEHYLHVDLHNYLEDTVSVIRVVVWVVGWTEGPGGGSKGLTAI